MVNIAIFASGTGSNATKIMEHFIESENVNVKLLVSNKRQAKVLDLADGYDISTLVINRTYFYDSNDILRVFEIEEIDLIVLAGFLWLIPTYIIEAYPKKIINIHPALLPKFGGKGMYGMNVHQAVKQAGECESGPTIHIVDEKYDSGQIIYQEKCQIDGSDTPESIAKKVLKLEHENYPKVIEKYINDHF